MGGVPERLSSPASTSSSFSASSICSSCKRDHHVRRTAPTMDAHRGLASQKREMRPAEVVYSLN
ncbi:hypothetical protein PR202_ga17568 [Eleusine coracana subsp. coracana]|uniref:Uncharacterized protein n=1 Tax=Eleusine coracana subsp. coracana TaxID=191504 RepID=A0AAV5CQH0_ELECO|nr:hypothetical protein PR202_ga17321 [Eleusine coracana subsp. coracana]GJN00389.1 hypothetical protein PR202_ga17568 [Eleusine coracana subsp. coracana]